MTALEALLAYTQADEDGTIVKVSRQAIHEVADELASLRHDIERAVQRNIDLLAENDALHRKWANSAMELADRESQLAALRAEKERAEKELKQSREIATKYEDRYFDACAEWEAWKKRAERAEAELAACREDAEKWNELPAFLEKYQINYVGLLRDIDAAIAARKGEQ